MSERFVDKNGKVQYIADRVKPVSIKRPGCTCGDHNPSEVRHCFDCGKPMCKVCASHDDPVMWMCGKCIWEVAK